MRNSQENGEEVVADSKLYRSIIGKLLYITHTCLDIVFTINYLSRFMNHPHKAFFSAVKQVVRYLAGSKDLRLWYSYGDERILESFFDSNWGNLRMITKELQDCYFSWE